MYLRSYYTGARTPHRLLKTRVQSSLTGSGIVDGIQSHDFSFPPLIYTEFGNTRYINLEGHFRFKWQF